MSKSILTPGIWLKTKGEKNKKQEKNKWNRKKHPEWNEKKNVIWMKRNVWTYEPRHEKTCRRGFRPGNTQTGLGIKKKIVVVG